MPNGGIPDSMIPPDERYNSHVAEFAEETALLRKWTTSIIVFALLALVIMAGVLLAKQYQRNGRVLDRVEDAIVALEKHENQREIAEQEEQESHLEREANLRKANLILRQVLIQLRRLNPNDPRLDDVDDLLIIEGEGETNESLGSTFGGGVQRDRRRLDSDGDVGDGPRQRRDERDRPRSPPPRNPAPSPSPSPSDPGEPGPVGRAGERVDCVLVRLSVDCLE